jgi:hypothetical protein
MFHQETHCMYNVIKRRLRVTIFLFRGKARSIKYYECVSVFLFCVIRVLYCRPWPVRLYSSFLHYPINVTIFGKTIIKHKICVLIFPQHLPETLLILRLFSEMLLQMCVGLHLSTRYTVRLQ